MAGTQPPYHTSTFGAPNQDINSTTPLGTYLGTADTGNTTTNTTDPSAGLDSNTTHSGVDSASNPDNSVNSSSNPGQHHSSWINKFDPRTKPTHQTDSGARDTTSPGTMDGGYTHGSSTGPAGATSGVQDTSSQYNRDTTGYNPSTGTGYSTTSGADAGTGYQPSQRNPDAQGDRAEYAPIATNQQAASGGVGSTESTAGRKGESIGKGIHSTAAGIHGAGESLRGALTAAVDRTFGSEEGVKKNQDIARKGEEQIQTGRFSR